MVLRSILAPLRAPHLTCLRATAPVLLIHIAGTIRPRQTRRQSSHQQSLRTPALSRPRSLSLQTNVQFLPLVLVLLSSLSMLPRPSLLWLSQFTSLLSLLPPQYFPSTQFALVLLSRTKLPLYRPTKLQVSRLLALLRIIPIRARSPCTLCRCPAVSSRISGATMRC